MYIKKLINPEFYQGNKKKKNYFEGWYYKLVSLDEHYTIALIPGVSKNEKDPHAFIQLFISETKNEHVKLQTFYFRYALNEFLFSYDRFNIQIGPNFFSKEKLHINLKNDKIHLYGTLQINDITPIKKKILMPNIMGFFGYFNFMECYHGVVSMNHSFEGSLQFNQTIINFDHAKGYIEKDWGKSFPRAYVWIQSNHFKNPKTSLMFSYADIPFLGFYFKGLIANLHIEGKEYRFATYNFAKVKKEVIEPKKVLYILKKGKYTLELSAESETETSLASPRNGQMIESIKEGLSGHVSIKLFKHKKLIYEDCGHHAGIEIMKPHHF
jgi:hypothetical protein